VGWGGGRPGGGGQTHGEEEDARYSGKKYEGVFVSTSYFLGGEIK
jgi:hypothetical protein